MKNNPKNEISLRISINESKQCVWCGTRNRYQLGRYCSKCSGGYYRWGHPDGRKLPISLYKPIKEQSSQLLEMNRDQKAVRYALKFCQSYLDKAEKNSSLIPNPMKAISALSSLGVTAEEMLLEAMAVYIYCTGQTSHSPFSVAPQQVGNAVLKLRVWDRPRKVLGHDRKAVGSYLITPLRPLFEKFKEAIKQMEQSRMEYEDVMENIELKTKKEPTE